MKAIFSSLCPNCNGKISDIRLLNSIPCKKCLPLSISQIQSQIKTKDFIEFQIQIGELLKKFGNLKNYKEIYFSAKLLKEFEEFFEKISGKKIWSAQREWARRIFKNLSFSITAPTGVGKTFFGILISLFLSTKNKKSYLILPTSVLVNQVYERALQLSEKVDKKPKILVFKSRMKKKEREEFFENLQNGNFNILITTSRFLSIHFPKLKHLRFDLIFVDDVDAMLKSSKNIDKALFLLGFTKKELEIASHLIKLKKSFASLKQRSAKEKLYQKIEEIEEKLKKEIENKKIGSLVVASATGKARGERIKFFRELLNFTIGSSTGGYRNIEDFYLEKKDVKKQVLELVKFLGDGGIIFVGIDEGSEFAEEMAKFLEKNGIKAKAYISGKTKQEVIEEFSEGKIDLLIGVASYYGLLVRGLDLPHRIRYVIFTSIPKFRFSIKFEEIHPFRIYVLLQEFADYMEEKDKQIANNLIKKFKENVLNLERSLLEKLDELIEKQKEIPEELKKAYQIYSDAKNFLKRIFEKESFLKKVEESPYISIKEIEGNRYILLPDVRTYIQASGRSSRLFAGGITKGISILLVDDKKVFNGLARQLAWYYEESEFREFEKEKVKEVLKEVDKDRELVRKILEGKIEAVFKDPIKSALLIVESPHKAETISSFFGKPSVRKINGLKVYEITTGDLSLNVVASKGHIMDLVENDGFHGVLVENGKILPIYDSIKKCKKCGHTFISGNKCPKCGSEEIEDSKERIDALKELANEVDLILLGTDPDREGEAIAWHLKNVVSINSNQVKRIEFHEITRRAIRKALQELRDIDENRVNAQIVRRIEDRWVGFELSQKLWKVFKNTNLSAGRVQTPVLGWIIERYDKYRKSWKFFAKITLENEFEFETKIEQAISKILQELRNRKIKVKKKEEYEKEINPLPPFSTDQMLLEASKILHFSAQKTMKLAQDLFESGLITYHRTDSHRVSNEGIRVASEYIKDRFGEEDFKARKWGEEKEGAHECIRPTKPIDSFELSKLVREGIIRRELSFDHIKLYGLIFRRFIASQMKPSKIIYQKIVLEIGGKEIEVEFPVEIKEDGFTKIVEIKVYPRIKEEVFVKNYQIKKKPEVYPFTQGEVIKEMKERGIGRPSTYAVIIQKLLNRRYVVERKGRLIPTLLGRRVYSFLTSRYKELVSEELTRKLEEILDGIEEGRENYLEILNEIYSEVKSLK